MACTCHDPAVFGHQDRCWDDLGPRVAGGSGAPPSPPAGFYGAEYPRPNSRLNWMLRNYRGNSGNGKSRDEVIRSVR